MLSHPTLIWTPRTQLQALLPPGAIIYPNECGDSVAPPLSKFPASITHVSIDYYAGFGPATPSGLNGSAEAAGTRRFVEEELYPRLQPDQKVFLVPGTFACSNLSYTTIAESDSAVAEKLEAYWAWADTVRVPPLCSFHPCYYSKHLSMHVTALPMC